MSFKKLSNASVTLSRIRATNQLRFYRLRMTTKLSKFVGCYDFSTEHNDYDLTTDPLRSRTGKYELEQSSTKQWELRRTGTDR
ncbi:hypothetical protein DPMN_181132 [Dreissena polymorpha]|uniref:Uncharacterized protein n=1 Tax=Dreissena polymorpha TaxID=45954 RepID=A0A9D4DDV8_DREPO|nr:hypothetical protein DPMN_181132 [Dreissena polymorpha]